MSQVASARWDAPLVAGELQGTFHTLRALTAGSSAAALALLTVSWDLRFGGVVALLLTVATVDALYRRRRPAAPLLPRLLLDATILGTAALVLGGSALVAAPFAYLLAAAFLLLPLRRALVVLAYLTAVITAVFLATARSGVIPADWPLALSVVLVFTGALAALLAAALRALQVSRVREHQALEEALRASRLKSHFVSVVSHELRTPLTSICGFAEMLQTSWKQLEEPEVEEYFQILLEETQHLAELIEDVLVIPVLEEGQLRLRPSALELAPLVERVAEMVFEARGERAPTIELPAHATVSADQTRVQQVVRNLLENARKYGGEQVRIEAAADRTHWILSVEDDGPGIPEADRYRVFDHFDRGSHESLEAGTGLGLPIARYLARAMGGDLWLEVGSRPGACFRFSLPRAEVPQPRPEPAATAS